MVVTFSRSRNQVFWTTSPASSVLSRYDRATAHSRLVNLSVMTFQASWSPSEAALRTTERSVCLSSWLIAGLPARSLNRTSQMAPAPRQIHPTATEFLDRDRDRLPAPGPHAPTGAAGRARRHVGEEPAPPRDLVPQHLPGRLDVDPVGRR